MCLFGENGSMCNEYELFVSRFQDKSSVCLKFHFLDILRQVMEEGRWGAHLRNSCRRLRIVHVSPEIAQVIAKFIGTGKVCINHHRNYFSNTYFMCTNFGSKCLGITTFLPAATKLWPRLCFYSCLSFC